jgi:uncharacterized Zn-binding protein involved in type VI secretion
MPAAARSGGIDKVFSKTGIGKDCAFPVTTVTGTPTCEVYVNGHKAVRVGDQVGAHAFYGCGPDTSTLTEGSSTVFIGGQRMGRIGDNYGSDNIIISGSQTVFVGG